VKNTNMMKVNILKANLKILMEILLLYFSIIQDSILLGYGHLDRSVLLKSWLGNETGPNIGWIIMGESE